MRIKVKWKLTPKAPPLGGGNHITSQLRDSSLMDIMSQDQTAGAQTSINDRSRSIIISSPVIGVQICWYNMVPKRIQCAQACASATEIWRTHICGISANDVEKSRFELVHLRSNSRSTKCAKVRVGPSMWGNLMSSVVGVLDDLWLSGGCDWVTPVCTTGWC